MKIAICDDEKYISDKVKKLALDFFHRKNVEIKIDGEKVCKLIAPSVSSEFSKKI